MEENKEEKRKNMYKGEKEDRKGMAQKKNESEKE